MVTIGKYFKILAEYLKYNKLLSALLLLNFISAIVAMYLGNLKPFPDEQEYWLAAEGLANGKFSSWYFLENYYPETLRTPGYSLFLLLFKSIADSLLFVKIVQLFFYFSSLFMSWKIVQKLSEQRELATFIFLSLSIINIQIPFYAGCISAETPSIFFTVLYVYIYLLRDRNYKNAIFLGLSGAAVFMMRPSFLLFPLLFTGYISLFHRKSIKFMFIHLIFFLVSLIPFSIWNYTTHGVFKPTPIEGGAGVAHMGYWNFKLPDGYQEKFYWGNVIVSDLTNPISLTDQEKENYKVKYEQEWAQLLEKQKPLLSDEDLLNLAIMKSDSTPVIFPLYNSKFTISREKELWKLLGENIKKDPIYYLKTRIYTFFRLYYVGLNKVKYDEQNGIVGKTKIAYPFIVTFIFILIGLLFSLAYFVIKKGNISHGLKLLLLLSLYQGLVHVPFAIHSRYTVPVHLLILILVAVIVSKLIKNEDELIN